MAAPCRPLGGRLFVGDDDVDVISAAQAVVGNREQRISIRGEVHSDQFSLFVDHVINEPGVLVAEAVMVLAPHERELSR